jgi:beta-lactamase regulating signal transducer with metallopeptidase domain
MSGLDAVAYWLIDYYITATIILAVVLLIQRCIRQPARRVALQWGALVGLTVLAFLCALPGWPRIDVIGVARAVPGAVFQQLPDPGAFRSVAADSGAKDASSPWTFAGMGRLLRWLAAQDLSTARLVALAVFAMGCLLTSLRVLHGVMGARRVSRAASLAPSNVVAELATLVGAQRCPALLISSSHPVPLATGTIWPKILLPPQFAEKEQPDDCRSVLAHELAHIQNGDLWLLALDRSLLPLFWLHPLYLRVRRKIRDDQELLADAFAASHSTRTDYANMLLRWARRLIAEKRCRQTPGTVGFGYRSTRLADRIVRLLHHSHLELCCPRLFRMASLLSLVALPVLLSTATVRPEAFIPRYEFSSPSSVFQPVAESPAKNCAVPATVVRNIGRCKHGAKASRA